MTTPSRLKILGLLNERTDQIKSKKSLNLGSFIQENEDFTESVIEIIDEYLRENHPGIEIERISLQNNHLYELPSNFKLLSNNLKYLDLHNNYLTKIPEYLTSLSQLEILDLSSNRLSNLPPDFASLKNLKVISLKDNRFQYLSPVLADLKNLNLIELARNPLILPSLDLIKNLQKQSSDLDWVSELKSYLSTHSSLLNLRLLEQMKQQSNVQPFVGRTRSVSDTKGKAARAARRMGLIIKKPDDTSSKDDSVLSEFSDSGSLDSLSVPHSASAAESSFNRSLSPFGAVSTYTSTTVPSSISSSTPTTPGPTSISGSNQSLATLSRPGSRNRSRSNTLKEIDKLLEKNGTVDTEHKSGAYFRRLSTLQELPVEGINSSNQLSMNIPYGASSMGSSVSSTSSRKGSGSQQGRGDSPHTEDESFIASSKSPSVTRAYSHSVSEASPSKGVPKKSNLDTSIIIKVSRKVLFAFSELHSSVRRFTGFCVDKRITIKMVSYLYSTKSNIDSLVEDLEILEESSSNLEQIVESLHSCIYSFKNIMNFLSENFLTFVMKTDICFIRMLYITLYGSLNELMNAYRILAPGTKPSSVNSSNISQQPSSTMPNYSTDTKQRLTVNTKSSNDSDDVDEKLYRSIDSATTSAQVVFSELTNAIGKSAIASATASSTPAINHNVATKVKELTNVCMTCMDITKRLKTKLITIRNNPSQTTRKLFWDDINLFLKSIIQTFSAVKGIMKDMPVLNEVRGAMANLTKTTKEVTILLEISSYKSMSSDSSQNMAGPLSGAPLLKSIPSVSNMFSPSHNQSQANASQMGSSSILTNQFNTPPIRTPLVATLGPAAQAIIPSSNSEITNNTTNPLSSPGVNNAPATAPVHSTGQQFAKGGFNPYDGLILSSGNKETETDNS